MSLAAESAWFGRSSVCLHNQLNLHPALPNLNFSDRQIWPGVSACDGAKDAICVCSTYFLVTLLFIISERFDFLFKYISKN